MEDNKIVEMNEEAIEVMEDCGGSKLGKIVLTASVIAIAGIVTCVVVKKVKKKIAAKKALAAKAPIEIECSEIVDDENDSEEI